MKTTEFVEQARNLKCITKIEESSLNELVLYSGELLVASIYIDEQFLFTLYRNEFTQLFEEEQKQLYKLITEYAETPVDERRNTMALRRTVEKELRQCVPEGYAVDVFSSNNGQGILSIYRLAPGSVDLVLDTPTYIQVDIDMLNRTDIRLTNYEATPLDKSMVSPSIPLEVLMSVLEYVKENKGFLAEVWAELARSKTITNDAGGLEMDISTHS